MLYYDLRADDAVHTVFRDFLFLIAGAILAALIVVLVWVNPPGVAQDDSKRPGNLAIEAHWPDGSDTDVDLWIEAPGEPRPVGYSNRGGRSINLLRDDLGQINDTTPNNYEFAYSRGLPAGEYTVNVHMFSDRELAEETPVTVVVSMRKHPTASAKQLLHRRVVLFAEGHEITVVRFTLDDEGELVESSVNDIPRMIRGGDFESGPHPGGM
jgi:hypothetical protein